MNSKTERKHDFDQTLSFINLGPSQIAYRKIGCGEPLILVHGFPLSGLTFRHVVPFLSDRFTCYIPDLPGAGETRWSEKTDFSSRGQAKTLKALIDELKLNEYSILAHDTGGTIARQLTLIARERVKKLILIGTEIPGHRPPWIPFLQNTSNPHFTILSRLLMNSKLFRHSSAGFGGCFFDSRKLDGEFYDLFVAPLVSSAKKTSGQIRYLMGIDWKLVDSFKTEHAKITAPTMLIWGEEETVFPVREARKMVNQFANCKGFVTVPKARLFVHEEKPETVGQTALDFLTAA